MVGADSDRIGVGVWPLESVVARVESRWTSLKSVWEVGRASFKERKNLRLQPHAEESGTSAISPRSCTADADIGKRAENLVLGVGPSHCESEAPFIWLIVLLQSALRISKRD